jgi:hypothetical protein
VFKYSYSCFKLANLFEKKYTVDYADRAGNYYYRLKKKDSVIKIQKSWNLHAEFILIPNHLISLCNLLDCYKNFNLVCHGSIQREVIHSKNNNVFMQVPKLSCNCLIRMSFHVCNQHQISINIRSHEVQLVIIKLYDVNIIIFAVNYLPLNATMTNQIKVEPLSNFGKTESYRI